MITDALSTGHHVDCCILTNATGAENNGLATSHCVVLMFRDKNFARCLILFAVEPPKNVTHWNLNPLDDLRWVWAVAK